MNKEDKMKVLIQLVMVLITVQVSDTLTDRDILRLSNGIILRYEGSGYLISGMYDGILVIDLSEIQLPRTVQIYCKPGAVGRYRRPLRVPLNESESVERNTTIEPNRNGNTTLEPDRNGSTTPISLQANQDMGAGGT